MALMYTLCVLTALYNQTCGSSTFFVECSFCCAFVVLLLCFKAATNATTRLKLLAGCRTRHSTYFAYRAYCAMSTARTRLRILPAQFVSMMSDDFSLNMIHSTAANQVQEEQALGGSEPFGIETHQVAQQEQAHTGSNGE